MLNQLTLVGRLVRNPEVTTSNDTKYSHITIAVPRSYKNVNGEYETDFIPVQLLKGIAENTVEYCKKGDLVGVKGRIQSNENGIYLLAEKITFLSSKKKIKTSFLFF